MQEESLSNRVKNTRYKLGLSQKQLANLLDVDETTVYRWERGKTKPSNGTLHILDIVDKDIETAGQQAVIADWLSQEKLDSQDVIKYRFALRMSQEQFAENLGVSLHTVQRWEAGVTPPKRMAMAIKNLVKKHGIQDSLEIISLASFRLKVKKKN